MKPIYQMNYDEFRTMCWNRWGISVSMSYVMDVNGKIVDHRESEITVKLPEINEDGTINLVNHFLVRRFRRLREAIEFVSKNRKFLKPRFEAYEREMKKHYGEKENV